MVKEDFYTQSQIDKLGNTIIYLCNKIKPLYKTKLLKLLYLLEEISIKKNGMPFLGLNFEVWKLGPVAKDIFIELSSTPTFLSSFIAVEDHGEDSICIGAIKDFSDDEFSAADLEILDLVAEKFKTTTANDLVKITHTENRPWYITAMQHGVLELFNANQKNNTDIKIDLSMLLDDRQEMKAFYLTSLEHIQQSKWLKR
jgi:uncharacterized phage-associated protein